MKKYYLTMALALLCAGVSFAADPVEGYWLNADGKSGWEIYQKDGVLFGKMLSTLGATETSIATKCRNSYQDFPVSGKVNLMPLLGTPWIFDLRMESYGRWSGGSIINPTDGSVYKCSIMYHPADGKEFPSETLEIRGHLLMFSGSDFWHRATLEEAASLR
jgi:uncharacterized protein (DUF2147 family)